MRWVGPVLLLPIVIAGWYLFAIGYGNRLPYFFGALFLTLILVADVFKVDVRRFLHRFVKPS
jgi:hypothetical protein